MIVLLGYEISGKIVNVVYRRHSISNGTLYEYRPFNYESNSWESPRKGFPDSMKDFPFKESMLNKIVLIASTPHPFSQLLHRIVFAKTKQIVWGRLAISTRRDVPGTTTMRTNNVCINGDFEEIMATSLKIESALYDEKSRIIYIVQLFINRVVFRSSREISQLSDDKSMTRSINKTGKILAVLQGRFCGVEIVDIIDDQYLCFFATIQRFEIMGFALNIKNKEWASYSFTMLNAAPQIGLVFVVPSMKNNACSAVTGYCRTNCRKIISIDVLRIIHRFYVGKKELHMITREFEHFHCCYSDFSRLVRDLFTKKRTSRGRMSRGINTIHHDLIRFTYLRYVNCTLR